MRYQTGAAAGAVYFALVFAAGFVLGIVRTLWIAPLTGEFRAVLLEVPVMIAVSILACLAVLRRAGLHGLGQRAVMAAVAFVLLLAAEYALFLVFVGGGPGDYAGELLRPAGLAGLAGQVVYGLLPVLLDRRERA